MATSENSVIEETQLTVASKPKRLKWTERMNSDLLECKRKANLRSGSIFVSLGETFRREGRNEK